MTRIAIGHNYIGHAYIGHNYLDVFQDQEMTRIAISSNERGSMHRIWLDHLMEGEFLVLHDHMHTVLLEVKHNYCNTDAVLCHVQECSVHPSTGTSSGRGHKMRVKPLMGKRFKLTSPLEV